MTAETIASTAARPRWGIVAGRQQWLKDAGWSLGAAVAARAASMVATITCARMLVPADFGQLALIQSTVGMFAPVAGLGLAMTSTKFLAEFRDTNPARAGRILGLVLALAVLAGAILTAVLAVLAPWLAQWTPAATGLPNHLLMASGLLWLGVLESVQIGALTGLGAFAALARAGVCSCLASVPVFAALTYVFGIPGAIAGLIVSAGISCIVHGWRLRAESRHIGIHATLTGAAAEKDVLVNFSLPSYASGLLVAPVAWFGSALLAQRPGGLTDLALFSAADRFRLILIFVPLALTRLTLPSLTRLRAANDQAAYGSTLRWNVLACLATTAGPALLCVLAAVPLMSLFGDAFRSGWLVLVLLAISAVPTVLNTQLGGVLLSNGHAWTRAAVDVLLAVTFLSLSWWLVPRWGSVGFAAVFVAAYSIACAVLGVFVWRSHRAVR